MTTISKAEDFIRIRLANPSADAILTLFEIWDRGHHQYCLRPEQNCTCGFYDNAVDAMKRFEAAK